ncbi:restriction endonuclease subunit S [Streptomyces mirabilis]|uniref:restriction endonuclease subunit S n=1 Tax=Streptomyces mirabilis TaxID=68239 RepID=UPI0036BF2FD2
MNSAPAQSARAVDWLTNVRPGWPTTTLGRVGRFHMGTTFPHAYQGATQGDLPFIKVSDFPRADRLGVISGANNWVDRQTARRLGARIVPRGSILYARVGAALLLNQRCITGRTCIVDDNVRAFEPKHGDPRYWRYLMLLLDMAKITNPGPVPSVSERQVAALPVPLPPVEEQRHIADFLDAETARIDRLAQLRSRQADVLEERCRLALDQAFEKPTYQSTRLKYLLAVKPRYGVLVPQFSDTGVRFIRVNDLLDLSGRADSLARIPDELSAQYSRTITRPGDVLLSVVGTMGRSAIVPPQLAGANVARAVASLRPRQGVPPELVATWLTTPSFLRQASDATGSDTAQPTLGMEDLSNFRLSWPVDARDRVDLTHNASVIRQHQRELNRALQEQREVLAERRQALITAAVTGQFDISTASGRNVTDGVTA